MPTTDFSALLSAKALKPRGASKEAIEDATLAPIEQSREATSPPSPGVPTPVVMQPAVMRGRAKDLDKVDFGPVGTRMSMKVKNAVEKRLIDRRAYGKKQSLSELLDELMRRWLKEEGVDI